VALDEASRVRLLWAANEEPDLGGYNIYRRVPGGQQRQLNDEPLPRAQYFDTDVAGGTGFVYLVTAIDLAGNESEPSEPASVSAR
jgi:fibronectin type 3 domain-containing protein